MYRSAPMIAALVLLGAASAHAGTRTGHLTGVVDHVDSLANLVYFTDGRTLHFQPGTTIITADGRPITLGLVTPGARLDVDLAANTAPAVVPGHPPVNASG